MALNLSDLGPSLERLLEAWRYVRICPNRIAAPKEILHLNLLTLGIVLAIFMLARASIAGADRSIASDVVSTVVSALVVFCSGYVVLIFDSSPKGIETARKWGLFFIMAWISSLLGAILIDGIAIWNHASPLTSLGIDTVFVPGTLPSFAKDTLRAAFFGILALTILVMKTKYMDPKFSLANACSIATLTIGLGVNTALLLLFLYSNFL